MGNVEGYWSRPEVVERERVRNQQAHRKAARKAYKKTEAGKESNRRYRRTETSKKYQRSSRLKQLYGITQEDYDEMYEEQGGVCDVCGKAQKTLHVDHNHDTGAVRGLLCGNCNRGLGIFKDDPELLRAATRYLRKHGL